MPMNRPPPKKPAAYDQEARVPAMLRVRGDQIVGIEDHLGNVLGMPLTVKAAGGPSGVLGIRASDASPAIPLPIEKSTKLRVQVAGGALYIRTPWDATYDAVQCVLVSTNRTIDSNNPVELGGARRIPVATADADIYTAWSGAAGGTTLLAGQGDDAPPQRYNGSTIGGNHKNEFCLHATAAGHGKTDADIGSLWAGSTLQYVLASIVDANTLRFVETATASVASIAGQTLTHVSGAASTASIAVTASASGRFPTLNNRSVAVFLDGVPIDQARDAVYAGARLEIRESYGIVNPVAYAAWLRTQVGRVSSGAAPSDAVADDVVVRYRWVFGENGSVTNNAETEFVSTVAVSNSSSAISWVQAARPNPTGGTEKTYVPDISPISGYDLKAIADTAAISTTLNIDTATWLDAKNPPNRQVQLVFVSTTPTIGQILGLSPLRGPTSRGRRAANTSRAGYFSTAKKNYIYAQNGLPYGSTTIPAGTVVKGVAYRHIYNPQRTPDATVSTWYWDGDEIVVTVDFHKVSTLSTIGLPAVAEGWAVTAIESTAVTLFSPVVDGGQIAVACTAAYGHAQYRVSAV